MKKVLNVGILILLTFVSCKVDRFTKGGSSSVLSADSDHAFHQNGRLKVIGTQLSNDRNQAIQLRGMSTHGLQYRGNCYNETSLNLLMNDWGADIMRIAMYAREEGYEKDSIGQTKFVDSLVNKCYREGIYALVDWHMLHPGDPNQDTPNAKQFFQHVSKKHAGKGNVIYEICNEPNDVDGEVTWAMIKAYAMEIIPIIRANDPQSIIIVGTPEHASRPDLAAENPLPYTNVMYTMHFYASDKWQDNHQGRRMGYVSKALEKGAPVFVTEFGTQFGTGGDANDFPMSTRWLKFLAERKISWCNWNYSDSPLSGAVWKNGTCPNGPWTDENLKESGLWIRPRINTPADNWTGVFHGWHWEYDLAAGTGNTTDYEAGPAAKVSESQQSNPGFLPYPTTGTARAGLAANAGAGFKLNNSILLLNASKNDVPNKFSLFDLQESSSLSSISFRLAFNNSSSGTAVLSIGSSEGTLYKNSAAYSNSRQQGQFAAIRFLVGTASTNAEYRYAEAGSFFHKPYDTNLFARTGNLDVDIFCNNTEVNENYQKNGVTYTLPPTSLHLFINGVQAKVGGSANIKSTGEVFSYAAIDAFMLSGSNSAGNTLNFSLSNLEIRSLKGI